MWGQLIDAAAGDGDAPASTSWLSKRNQQLRDVWDIPACGHENKGGHPSPKPLAVIERIFDVAGKPGGLLLNLFSGSGTGAVAALTWGGQFRSNESWRTRR
jgi:DNA modification methylase